MVQHGTLLSEVRATPGPTHSVADVIAATAEAVRPGGRMAMLGFAGGGVLAPLRGLGGTQAVSAVDLDDSGWKVFWRLCADWAGALSFEHAEACAWLRAEEGGYDLVVEDLSVPTDSDVFKPEVTWTELPSLLYRRLNPGGIVIFNLLHPTTSTWETGIQQLLQRGFQARLIGFRDYENRLLITGADLPGARQLGRQVRDRLRILRSRLALCISVTTVDTTK
jgi:hypothetical protein